MTELLRYARVTRSSAVLLGSTTAADGHEDGRIVRVVTHAHNDHIVGLEQSITRCTFVAATPATLEVLDALGYRIPKNKALAMDYGVKVDVEDDTIYLERARHILGAAQVVVETRDGVRVAYTGDFKLPGTKIIDADVLVIEATYGKPEYVRPFKDEVEQLFADLVMDLLMKGPVYIYGYHGKLQEAMSILRAHGVDAPFIAPQTVYRISRIAEKYGENLSPLYHSHSREAREVMKDGWYVYFTHMMSRKRAKDGSSIILTGWEFNEPFRRNGDRSWIVALSDHADFEQLLEYVDQARPRLVITDAARKGCAKVFAREVEKRLGIKAIPMP